MGFPSLPQTVIYKSFSVELALSWVFVAAGTGVWLGLGLAVGAGVWLGPGLAVGAGVWLGLAEGSGLWTAGLASWLAAAGWTVGAGVSMTVSFAFISALRLAKAATWGARISAQTSRATQGSRMTSAFSFRSSFRMTQSFLKKFFMAKFSLFLLFPEKGQMGLMPTG